MQNQESRSNFWQPKWLRVAAGFLAGAIIFFAIVFVLWMVSYYSRLILPFDLIFQSPAILSLPVALIPLVFYDVLALPPVLILAIVISWAFGRYLRRTKGLNLPLCILIGIVAVPMSILLVSIFGMVISGGASEASAFAFFAPFPPSFVLGFLPGRQVGRLLYAKLTSRVSPS